MIILLKSSMPKIFFSTQLPFLPSLLSRCQYLTLTNEKLRLERCLGQSSSLSAHVTEYTPKPGFLALLHQPPHQHCACFLHEGFYGWPSLGRLWLTTVWGTVCHHPTPSCLAPKPLRLRCLCLRSMMLWKSYPLFGIGRKTCTVHPTLFST